MTDNIKILYSFTVEQTAAVGDTPAVLHYFAFKKPSRAEREDADAWRAAWWNKYLEKGLMPEAILSKMYANSGGTMNNVEKAEFDSIRAQLLTKQDEQERAMLGTDITLRNTLTNEVLDLRERFLRLQQSQEAFFQNTAEAKARTKLIEWLILNLSYHRNDSAQSWEPFFAGDDTEAKTITLEKFEDTEDNLYLKAREQLTFIAALFVSLNGALKKEDIDTFLAPSISDASPSVVNAETESKPTT